jgi:hypothetical protein
MDELGKSLPLSESMVDAEQGPDNKPVNEHCLNCGTKLLNRFCHYCGQKDLPKRQTLRELIENFLGSFFSFESKFFRTVKFLLLRPGFLPIEYTSGKRESFYHPARAYVFISFIFFLLLFYLPDSENEVPKNPLTEKDKQEIKEGLEKMSEVGVPSFITDSLSKLPPEQLDSIITYSWAGDKTAKTKKRNSGFSLTDTEYKTVAQYDSAQNALPEDKRDNWFMRKLNIRSIELNQLYNGDEGGKRFKSDFGRAFFDAFPKVLFFLLPVFALLLKLLYIRRDFYYSEHLVFSIYYYNFFYLASIIILLAGLIPFVGGWLTAIIVMWMIAYLPMSMKRMYKQRWGKTILKFTMLFFSFSFCLLTGIAGSMLLIIMNL